MNEADGTESDRERETEVNRIVGESGQGRGDRKNGARESSGAGSAAGGDWREGRVWHHSFCCVFILLPLTSLIWGSGQD